MSVQKVKTHEYVPTNGSGCQQCGKGVGALEHNTTQPFWYALRSDGNDGPQLGPNQSLEEFCDLYQRFS
jgi:hypothetical protein